MKSAEGTNPWLVVRKPEPRARLRLFCFPYAGGNALVYRKWPDLLPKDVEVIAVQPPGRGSRIREAPFTNLMSLVDALAGVLRQYLDKPFVFFGHSMGAVIAFELARVFLKEKGIEPKHLLVSGRMAPPIPDRDQFTYDLPEPEFIEDLRRLNGTPKEVLESAELLQLMMPLLRADFELIQTYKYEEGPRLTCPITAFGGLLDKEVSREDLAAWNEFTTGPFVLRMLEGDHFFIHSSEMMLLRLVAQDLHQILSRAA